MTKTLMIVAYRLSVENLCSKNGANWIDSILKYIYIDFESVMREKVHDAIELTDWSSVFQIYYTVL